LFQFQTETAILKEWFKTRALHTLIGFENDCEDGTGSAFNFILSNGTRSTQCDEDFPTKYEHIIPNKTLKRIRSVTIIYSAYIFGFKFFDKHGALLWKIGDTNWRRMKDKVELADNEVIVGVVAKLRPDHQSVYTDF
jgi:hypothetical protein